MKILTATIYFFALTTICQAQDTNPPAVGRFQLIQAVVMVNQLELSGTANSHPEQRLFRIDTATGTVWIYSTTQIPIQSNTNTLPLTLDGWTVVPEEDIATQWLQAQTNYQAQISNQSTNPTESEIHKILFTKPALK